MCGDLYPSTNERNTILAAIQAYCGPPDKKLANETAYYDNWKDANKRKHKGCSIGDVEKARLDPARWGVTGKAEHSGQRPPRPKRIPAPIVMRTQPATLTPPEGVITVEAITNPQLFGDLQQQLLLLQQQHPFRDEPQVAAAFAAAVAAAQCRPFPAAAGGGRAAAQGAQADHSMQQQQQQQQQLLGAPPPPPPPPQQQQPQQQQPQQQQPPAAPAEEHAADDEQDEQSVVLRLVREQEGNVQATKMKSAASKAAKKDALAAVKAAKKTAAETAKKTAAEVCSCKIATSAVADSYKADIDSYPPDSSPLGCSLDSSVPTGIYTHRYLQVPTPASLPRDPHCVPRRRSPSGRPTKQRRTTSATTSVNARRKLYTTRGSWSGWGCRASLPPRARQRLARQRTST